ncbi:DUF971 domain-containing protein [Roseibium denhamense]|uniref:DUF971 family protein n=1 Tax=Roseibium denhamense TaxID=76305 RepID=A0ABY1NS96_9HYPH|nr:DUF971 domain-containing protein [Roseibium denhamense]MTI08122.1 DUF971 domain-containing protein [Roseibium denhamense]SMP16595.1 DUF971 family protein [Roseibium denhamense]
MSASDEPWPSELRVAKDRRTLTIGFDNGERHDLSAEYLRVCSPSAEVKGHHPSQKKTVPGKRNVEIIKIEPVGNYAVRIHFDDMHSSGIYSWRYFRDLATHPENHWEVYLQELAAKGLSR